MKGFLICVFSEFLNCIKFILFLIQVIFNTNMKHIKQLLIVKDNFFPTELPTYFTNLDRKEAAIEHRQIKRDGKGRGIWEVLPNGPNAPSAGTARKAFRHLNF